MIFYFFVGAIVVLSVGHCSYRAGRARGYIDGLNDGSMAAYRGKP